MRYTFSIMEAKPSKTKVLFVITKSNWGGAQKYVYDLATSLPSETFEVVIGLGGHGPLKDNLHKAHIRTITIPFLARDINLLGDMRSFFELVRIFRAEAPHVVHVNSSKAGIIGGLAARMSSVPHIIFTAHGWAFNEDRSTLSRLILKTLSWITVLLSHATIAVSRAIARDMRWIGAVSKIQVINNGIHSHTLHTRDEARAFLNTLTQTPIPHDAFIFGTIAELHPSKGLSYAIRAFRTIARENPHTYYAIIGGGQEERILQNLIAEEQLEGRVLLLGFLEDAASQLKAFDCFILPSTTEALGYVLLEAGQAKLPVIASNVGGIPEIIEDMKTGLLTESRNVTDLENAMKEILASPTHGIDLGQALSVKVAHEYSFSATLMQTTKIFTYGKRKNIIDIWKTLNLN